MLDLADKKGQSQFCIPIILTHLSVAFGKLVTLKFHPLGMQLTAWVVGETLSFPGILCSYMHIYIYIYNVKKTYKPYIRKIMPWHLL